MNYLLIENEGRKTDTTYTLIWSIDFVGRHRETQVKQSKRRNAKVNWTHMFKTKCLSTNTLKRKRCLLIRCHKRSLLTNSDYFISTNRNRKKKTEWSINFSYQIVTFVTLINFLFNSSDVVSSIFKKVISEIRLIRLFLIWFIDRQMIKVSMCVRLSVHPLISLLNKCQTIAFFYIFKQTIVHIFTLHVKAFFSNGHLYRHRRGRNRHSYFIIYFQFLTKRRCIKVKLSTFTVMMYF
jgi:hypothetical protein